MRLLTFAAAGALMLFANLIPASAQSGAMGGRVTDVLSDYKRIVREHLLVPNPSEISHSASILFYPAFHAEMLIRIETKADLTIINLRRADGSIWYRMGRARAAQSQVPLPPALGFEAAVAPDRANRFWPELEAMLVAGIVVAPSYATDGVMMEVDCRTPIAQAKFDAHSPRTASPAAKLVNLMFDLASETFVEGPAVEHLEQLFGYLRSNLPVRVVQGEVTSVRLFGGLSVYHKDELTALFENLPQDQPVVVDMTNIDSMGAVLHGIFVKLASERPRVAFAASNIARRHLGAMGLDPRRIHDQFEDAATFTRQSR